MFANLGTDPRVFIALLGINRKCSVKAFPLYFVDRRLVRQRSILCFTRFDGGFHVVTTKVKPATTGSYAGKGNDVLARLFHIPFPIVPGWVSVVLVDE